jgi:hypothetical protein
MQDKLCIRFRELKKEDLQLALKEKKPMSFTFFYMLGEIATPVYIEEMYKDDAGKEVYLYIKVRTVAKDGKEWISEGAIVVGSGEGVMFESNIITKE